MISPCLSPASVRVCVLPRCTLLSTSLHLEWLQSLLIAENLRHWRVRPTDRSRSASLAGENLRLEVRAASSSLCIHVSGSMHRPGILHVLTLAFFVTDILYSELRLAATHSDFVVESESRSGRYAIRSCLKILCSGSARPINGVC